MPAIRKPTKPRAKSASPTKAVPKKKVIVPNDEVSSSSSNATGSKFAVGDQVTHPMFGQGAVIPINADKLTIEFADRVREIVEYYVRKSK